MEQGWYYIMTGHKTIEFMLELPVEDVETEIEKDKSRDSTALTNLVNKYISFTHKERKVIYPAMNLLFNGYNAKWCTSYCWLPTYEKIEKTYADMALNYQI